MEKLAVIDISQLGPEKRQNDFFANKIPDHILKNKSKITKPHKHNSYLAVLFTKGSGRHEVDFNSYDIKPGSLFLLSPGQSHHWE
ncbi:MAG TPA: AraC family ligand binding domain-containing protein, partial [Flavobacterium sp.]|nr:AraC family ligand binding domain-containing protein [Flavobacterium sp.]